MISNDRYVELHCHSNYSFQEGASFIHELIGRAKELDYTALALTDHDNMCGSMEFAKTARSLGIQAIIGAEVTLTGGYHVTLLSETREGYGNLCKLLSYAYVTSDRRNPELNRSFLSDNTKGLILLSGCSNGEMQQHIRNGDMAFAEEIAVQYIEWFGKENFYIELQQNLVKGNTKLISGLVQIAKRLGVEIVATNNVHYHIEERYQLQDCLVAIKNRKSLDDSHINRRANSEFYLKSTTQMSELFQYYPEAIQNTSIIAERCKKFDLTKDLGYRLPKSPVPDGYTEESYLRSLCEDAARRRYGSIDEKIESRLNEEFRLLGRHQLYGFMLLYHDIIQIAREVMIDLGLADIEIPLEENPPGRGRGSSVCMLVGYLIGLSHIDPIAFGLSLERFLPDDDMASMPDIDLDFPRNIRKELIERIHEKYGWDKAVITGMISRYKLKGAVRDLGMAFGLTPAQTSRFASMAHVTDLYKCEPMFNSRMWSNFLRLVKELEGFPKYLAQHPGGMVIGLDPLTNLVPVQPSAIDGRYIMHWDKDSVEDAGFVKIDFLALGTLSQLQDILDMLENKIGYRYDLSRINFEDKNVYDMISRADTIGVFQIESPAQMQTTPRIRPRNLFDMAHEIAAVRPGVGVNDGVSQYIRRRSNVEPITFENDLERRALEKTHGVILFQDQVNQVAMDVAGFSPLEADQLRRAYGRNNRTVLLKVFWQKFKSGALKKGIDTEIARRIFAKFNGHYMFPESHAFAFGVTAYQAAWLKFYYPLEFYVAIFNQQPMGFYSLETLKEDAKRHGILILNPDVNLSREKCIPDGGALRLGFLNVEKLGSVASVIITKALDSHGYFTSVEDFMERTRLQKRALDNLADAGAFDGFDIDRRAMKWKIGLLYRPLNKQIALPIPIEQDIIELGKQPVWNQMESEYRVMGLHTKGHILGYYRRLLDKDVMNSMQVLANENGARVTVAGLVIRRQRPVSKAVFITLEDEYGHVPLLLWPKTYERLKHVFSEYLVVVNGYISRRQGVMNVIVVDANIISGPQLQWRSRDWS